MIFGEGDAVVAEPACESAARKRGLRQSAWRTPRTSSPQFLPLHQVTLSSLNRHAVATRADVGLPKATVLERHFEAIVPEAQVEARVEMYTVEAEESALAGAPDFVIDAIDNIDTKVWLPQTRHRLQAHSLFSSGVSRSLPVGSHTGGPNHAPGAGEQRV